jgi:hypothetical protein
VSPLYLVPQPGGERFPFGAVGVHCRNQPRVPRVHGGRDGFCPFEQVLQLFTGRWLEGDHRTGRVRDLTRPAQRGHRPHAVQSPDYPSDLQHEQVSLAIGLSRRLPAGLVRRTAVRRVEVVPEGTAHGQVLHDERVLHGQQELNVIQDLILLTGRFCGSCDIPVSPRSAHTPSILLHPTGSGKQVSTAASPRAWLCWEVRIGGWDIRSRWFGVAAGATPRLALTRCSPARSTSTKLSGARLGSGGSAASGRFSAAPPRS